VEQLVIELQLRVESSVRLATLATKCIPVGYGVLVVESVDWKYEGGFGAA
jgi:hypothetical protein